MIKEVLWEPQAKQELALIQEDFEIGFGGARGGGKTDGGMGWLLYDKDHPKLRALIIRKNATDLTDWIDRARQIYEPLGAVFKGTPTQIIWPSGAIFRLGHYKDEKAYTKYQGHEYQRMLLEELTQIPTELNYLMLLSSCRSTVKDLPPQAFSTFNPDGAGFTWVRKRWNLKGIPKGIIRTKDPKTGLSRVFIPSRLEDNIYLAEDGHYKSFLDGLPDGLREAWRDGSWSDPTIRGAYYTRELLQARKEGRIKLVPHDPALKVHTVWDLGIDDSMTMGFFQRTAKDISMIDYYENEGFGIAHYIAKLGERRSEKSYVYGKHFAPFDLNKRELSTGKTVKQAAKKLGIDFEIVPKLKISDGIEKVRLMFPRLYISEEACEQALNAFRNYRKVWDEGLLKYKDEPLHDWASHAADMLRYTAISEDHMTNEDEEEFEKKHKQPEYEASSQYEG